MKNNEKLMAEQLFFQTDLTKTQIAEVIGINRRTLSHWINDNNWDRTRKSAHHMPCLLAESMYIAMGHLLNSVLSDDRMNKPITESESRTLHRLSLDISRLKNRSTLNENLEMLRYFMEFVNDKDEKAVDTIQPLVNEYIKSRAKVQPGLFMPPGFNDYGYKPKQEEDTAELQKDIFERMTEEEYPATNEPGKEEETPVPTASQTPARPASKETATSASAKIVPAIPELAEIITEGEYAKALVNRRHGNRAARYKLAHFISNRK